MRISSAGIHNASLIALQRQQSILSRTQTQIASGKRVQTPADDPVAAVHLIELDRAIQQSDQFGRNANSVRTRLTLEESALADTTTLLQRVRELTVQGANASVDGASRRMISTEIRARVKDLQDIANRRDANDEYLFGGYASKTQPFDQTATGTVYRGDQGNRLLQIGPTQRVADSDTGNDVFMRVTEGNGTFVTDVNPANAGNAFISVGSVSNLAQWVPDDYTITFTPDASTYEVRDSANNLVAGGAYVQDGAIAFRGISVNLKGTPAVNDTFTVSAATTEDVFTTLDTLVAALDQPNLSDQQRAVFNTAMGKALQQLDATQDHIASVRATVGTRLDNLDVTDSSRADEKVELERTASTLRDLDYADAITKMNQQLVGLQAAQQSYSRIAQLSLFNYL